MVCVGLAAKDFELKRYNVEKEGGRDGHLLDLLEHYRDRQNFYEELEQKVRHAIENNQF